MSFKNAINTAFIRRAGNFLTFGIILFVLFNPTAKVWLLRQLMTVGLFKAEIKKEAPAVNLQAYRNSFSFHDKKGNIISTLDLKGKVLFINFWATWCTPCLAEMPALNDLYNKFRNEKKIVFLFLNEDDDASKAVAYFQKMGFAMPLITRAGNVPSEIFSGTLPTTVVLDKDGKIVYRHEGLAKYNSTEFINQLKELL